MPLSYTPRRLIQHPHRPIFYILETDHNTSALPTIQTNGAANGDANGHVDGYDAVTYGLPKTGSGHWASCIRVIDPLQKETILKLDLEEDEGAFCASIVHFTNKGDNLYLVVATGKGITFDPPSVPQAFINTYYISPDGKHLRLEHKTPCEMPPGALMPFQGKLLAGVGRSLRIYEMGQQRLLRKYDADVFPLVHRSNVSMHTKRLSISTRREVASSSPTHRNQYPSQHINTQTTHSSYSATTTCHDGQQHR
jgi:splicing factor 3B subunit 3